MNRKILFIPALVLCTLVSAASFSALRSSWALPKGSHEPKPQQEQPGKIDYFYYRYKAADLYAYVFDQDDPLKCREMCFNEPNCKAWTTNTPACNTDNKARCWLHSTRGTREAAKPDPNKPYCTNASGVILHRK